MWGYSWPCVRNVQMQSLILQMHIFILYFTTGLGERLYSAFTVWFALSFSQKTCFNFTNQHIEMNIDIFSLLI